MKFLWCLQQSNSHIGITLSVVHLSVYLSRFAFAGATGVPQNTSTYIYCSWPKGAKHESRLYHQDKDQNGYFAQFTYKYLYICSSAYWNFTLFFSSIWPSQQCVERNLYLSACHRLWPWYNDHIKFTSILWGQKSRITLVCKVKGLWHRWGWYEHDEDRTIIRRPKLINILSMAECSHGEWNICLMSCTGCL